MRGACGGLRRAATVLRDPRRVPGLVEPLDPGLARALRAAALELRERRRGRTFPAEVSVGCLGLPRGDRPMVEVAPDEAWDLTLRSEVVAALLGRALAVERRPVAWLARPGSLSWHDRDAEWWPAFESAFAEASVPLSAVVVTKNGWYDPRSGLSREWRRLRRAAPACPGPRPDPRPDPS